MASFKLQIPFNRYFTTIVQKRVANNTSSSTVKDLQWNLDLTSLYITKVLGIGVFVHTPVAMGILLSSWSCRIL